MDYLSKSTFVFGFLPSLPSHLSIPVHIYTPNLVSTLLMLDLITSGDRFCLLQSKKHRRVKRVILMQEHGREKENNSDHKVKKTEENTLM